MGSYESLYFLVYRGPQVSVHLTGSMCTTVRSWDRAKVLMRSETETWSPDAPLWFNPRLPHFGAILDPKVWARDGIKQLKNIVGGGLLTFDQLRDSHRLGCGRGPRLGN